MKRYTIQTAEGDRGWIQIILNGKEIDEVQGYTTTFNPEYAHYFIDIDKRDYDMMLFCHQRFEETEDDRYLEIVDKLTAILLGEQNN